jgi:hypothetical protein
LRTEYAEGLFFPARAHAHTVHTHNHLYKLPQRLYIKSKGCNSVSSFGIVKCAHANYLIGHAFKSYLTHLCDYLPVPPAPPAPPTLPTLPTRPTLRTRPTLPIRSTKDQKDDYKERIQRALKTLNKQQFQSIRRAIQIYNVNVRTL